MNSLLPLWIMFGIFIFLCLTLSALLWIDNERRKEYAKGFKEGTLTTLKIIRERVLEAKK